MADSRYTQLRYTQLRHTLANEALTEAERTWGIDFVDTETPATRTAMVNTLLRGVCAERGHLLSTGIEAAKMSGRAMGEVLLNWLLNSNRKTEANPGGVFGESAWEKGLAAVTKLSTCSQMLEMLLAIQKVVRARQAARQAA